MKNVFVILIILSILSGSINFLEAQQRSTALALGLSIGVPVVGCLTTYAFEPALSMVILAIGPSAGHFYAEQWTTGLVFTGLRTATLGLSTVIAIAQLWDEFSETGDPWYGFVRGAEVFAMGITVCCVIAVVDWIYVPASVNKYNERLQIRPQINLREKQYSIGLAYRF